MQHERGFITFFQSAYQWSFFRASPFLPTIPVTFSFILSFYTSFFQVVSFPQIFRSTVVCVCPSLRPALLKLCVASRCQVRRNNFDHLHRQLTTKTIRNSRLLNNKMSDSYLEGEEETLGSCTHALYALEEPHSSGSEMTSCFCNKHMSCVHTKRSRLERKGHGDGELCSDV